MEGAREDDSAVLYTRPMLTTRRASVEDAGLITRHRQAMFADMRDASESVLDEMVRRTSSLGYGG